MFSATMYYHFVFMSISLAMLGFGCSGVIVFLQIDSAIKPSLSNFLVLFEIFFFKVLPYFFSGITITLALKHYSKNVTVLSCYDLVGAGLYFCYWYAFYLFMPGQARRDASGDLHHLMG